MAELLSLTSDIETLSSGVPECRITYLSDHAFEISFPVKEVDFFPKVLASNECRPLCSTWKVMVHMYPPKSNGAFLLRVKLVRLDHKLYPIKACSVIKILDSQGVVICKMKGDSTFFTDRCITSSTMSTRVSCGKEWSNPNYKLEVNVQVSSYGCCKATNDERLYGNFKNIYLKPPTPEMNLIQLQSDLLCAYDSGLLEDVKIAHIGNIVKGNKFILGTRTEFFFNYFENKKMHNRIHQFHKVYGSRTIAAFLRFLYTEWLEEDLSLDMIIQLRQISYYYGVQSLWDLCEKLLVSNLSLDNWCTIFELTYLFEDPRIREAVHKFVKENERELSSKTDWKDRLEPKNKLFCDLCMRHDYILNLVLKDRKASKEKA